MDEMNERGRAACKASGGHEWTDDLRQCWRCHTKPTEEEWNAAESKREAERAENRARYEAAKRENQAIVAMERCWERNR